MPRTQIRRNNSKIGKLELDKTLADILGSLFRHSRASGYEYVWVNQDGSVREVSPGERSYLEEYFHPSDSGRPYIKSRYHSRDGWDSLSGFMRRNKVPIRITIRPVSPTYDLDLEDLRNDFLEENREVGDIITKNPDGSVTCIPNPELSVDERFEKLRQLHLQKARVREKLAEIRHSKS